MTNYVKVKLPEESANPRSLDSIKFENGRYVIETFIEDDNPYYRCRLDVVLENTSDKDLSVPFTIIWRPGQGVSLHSYVLLTKNEEDWTEIKGQGENNKVHVNVDVPPGISRLSMHPPYDYSKFIKLLNILPQNIFDVKIIGKSYNNRNIYAVEAGASDKRPLAVITRIHPYETIGSYFADGMIRWLLNNDEKTKEFLASNRVILIPMPNPDGVVEGYCRTTLGMLDLSYMADSEEPEAASIIKYVSQIKPRAIFDLHGYMYDYERMRSNDGVLIKKLHEIFKASPDVFNNEIKAFNDEYPPNGKGINIGGYLLDNFGTTFFNSSWSWYGRDAEHLRRMGIEILKGYASLFR